MEGYTTFTATDKLYIHVLIGEIDKYIQLEYNSNKTNISRQAWMCIRKNMSPIRKSLHQNKKYELKIYTTKAKTQSSARMHIPTIIF